MKRIANYMEIIEHRLYIIPLFKKKVANTIIHSIALAGMIFSSGNLF